MFRRQPISTCTDTRCPYTTLFRYLLTGKTWIDPVTSLIIVAVIGWGTWGLLKDSLKMGLLAVPDGIDEGAVRAHLAGLPGVSAVHDLHIWRSEEHTSELQSLMRISYAVFCLKKENIR